MIVSEFFQSLAKCGANQTSIPNAKSPYGPKPSVNLLNSVNNYEDKSELHVRPSDRTNPYIKGPTIINNQSSNPIAKAYAKAYAQAKAEGKAEANSRAEAEAKSRSVAEAQANARSEAEAKVRAEAEAHARAEAKVRAELEAKARARAEAKARAESEANAKAEAEAKARASEYADLVPKAKEKVREGQPSLSKNSWEVGNKEAFNSNLKLDWNSKPKTFSENQGYSEIEDHSDWYNNAKSDFSSKWSRKSSLVEQAKAKIEAELQAKRQAEERTRLEIEAKARAEAEIKAKQEKELKAKIEAEAKLEAQAKFKANAIANAETEARKSSYLVSQFKTQNAARAQELARAKENARLLAEAKAKADSRVQALIAEYFGNQEQNYQSNFQSWGWQESQNSDGLPWKTPNNIRNNDEPASTTKPKLSRPTNHDKKPNPGTYYD